MHIPDGILPAQICIGGYAIAGGVTWLVLKRLSRQNGDLTAEVPEASLLAAAFFVGSSINLPIPPASVHLVLNGLLGVLLGWYAWPAILVGLLLQAILLGHGGLTTLGVNAVMIGGPALIAHGIFQIHSRLERTWPLPWAMGSSAFWASAIGLGLSASCFFSLILLTMPANLNAVAEQQALTSLMVAHIPLMLIEGTFTLLVTLFLLRVKPELLHR